MDWALLVVSVALVIVTTLYTIHTRAMVTEMRETRLLSVRPRIGLAIHVRGPTFGAIRVTNVGHGPAIDARLTLRVRALEDERSWTTPLLSSGEFTDFYLRDPTTNSALDLPQASDANAIVEVEGAARDLYGTQHAFSDSFDIGEWWRAVVAANQAYREDPIEVSNRELKKLREAVEKIHRDLVRQPPKARRGSD